MSPARNHDDTGIRTGNGSETGILNGTATMSESPLDGGSGATPILRKRGIEMARRVVGTRKDGWKRRMTVIMKTEVDLKKTHIILIGLFFVTGLVDSAAYSIWSCFVSMQTGNTVFVALGVSDQPVISPPFRWTKCLVAILCYLLGAFCFSSFHRLLGPIRKGTLLMSFAFQTMVIATVAVLVATKTVSHRISQERIDDAEAGIWRLIISNTTNWKDLAPISLLAFQAAGQVVASRVLQQRDLPTAVVTSLMCDVMSDAHLLTAGVFENSNRNRRSLAALMLFLGAIVGGVLAKSWVGLAGVLYVAMSLKALMVIAWLLWPYTKEES